MPFDCTRFLSPRTRALVTQVGLGYGGRIASMAFGFLWVKLAIDALGVENYGVFVAISSITAFLTLSEAGTGAGLRNLLSESLAVENLARSQTLISTAYLQISALVATVAFLFATLTFLTPWEKLIGSQFEGYHGIDEIMLVCILGTAITLISSLIYPTAAAAGLPSLQTMGAACAAACSCALLYGISRFFGSASIVAVALCLAISTLFVSIVLSVAFFSKKRDLLPRYRHFCWSISKKLFSLGAQLFLINVAVYFIFTISTVFIANLVGPAAVTEVALTNRVFMIIQTLMGVIVFSSLTPMIQSRVTGEHVWFRKFIKSLVGVFVGLSVASIVLALLTPFLVQIWIGDEITLSPGVVWFQCAITIVSLWNNIFGTALISTGVLRPNLLAAGIGIVVNLSLAFPLGKSFDAPGILAATFIALIPSAIILPSAYFKLKLT